LKKRRKKLRKIPLFVPDNPPDGLLSKNPQFFFEKNYNEDDEMIFDDTEMFFLIYNTVDICGHYIFFVGTM